MTVVLAGLPVPHLLGAPGAHGVPVRVPVLLLALVDLRARPPNRPRGRPPTSGGTSVGRDAGRDADGRHRRRRAAAAAGRMHPGDPGWRARLRRDRAVHQRCPAVAALARRLREAGLSYLCWSRHAVDDADNRPLMGDAAPDADTLLEAVAAADLKVRATCVMHAAGVADPWRRVGLHRRLPGPRRRRVHVQAHVRRPVDLAVRLVARQPLGQRPPGRPRPLRRQAATSSRSLPWGPTIRRIGEVQVCHYYEPTPDWELAHRLARSSNLLSDGRVYASLEDQTSLLHRLGSGATTRSSPPSTPVSLRRPSPLAT